MKYLYGPVLSRRLGASLGIDLVPHKTCSFDCVYCQCGPTTRKTLKRAEYVPAQSVLKEIKSFLARHKGRLDYLTFSGSGEPTLNSKIGFLIREIKKITDKRIAVITNSSLIWRGDVRDDLMGADLVVPSLDAATTKAFRNVNRPANDNVSKIINGLVDFRKCFKGKLWLEILLVRFCNDDKENLRALKRAIRRIRPDRVQLNTVTRPPAYGIAYTLESKELKKIARFLGKGTRVIAETNKVLVLKTKGKDPKNRILKLLARRPCRVKEVARALGLHMTEALKYVVMLEKQKKITRTLINNRVFYCT